MREATDTVTQAASGVVSTVVDYTLPRGIRLNNPGNIKHLPPSPWLGKAADQSADPTFVTFQTPEYGIRAMARLFRTYAGRGVQTLANIIATWAPEKDSNKVGPYIAHVSALTGIPATAVVPESAWPSLIAAIITHENGRQPYTPDVIARGVALERSS